MKKSQLALAFFFAFLMLPLIIIAQPQTHVTGVDSLAYFPHWELVKDGKTTTSLHVTFLGTESLGDSSKIFVRFYKEDGTPLEGQPVQLYQASSTFTEVNTFGGYVYFKLAPQQTAKLVLTFSSRPEPLSPKPLSFGYATLGWKKYTDNVRVAKFLAWGEVITIKSGVLGSGAIRGEASITVNGGLPFEVQGKY